jgi:electron transfer flavoprotein alpha subunit
MNYLVIAEHNNSNIRCSTLNTITAATHIGSGEIHVLVAGYRSKSVASEAASIQGVAKVIHIDHRDLAHGIAEHVAAQIIPIAHNYSHILFPSTRYGKNISPRVAALLDVSQVSNVMKIISDDTFEQPDYSGQAISTLRTTDRIKVITVRITTFDPALPTQTPAVIESVAAVQCDVDIQIISTDIDQNPQPDLLSAKIVLFAGSAFYDKDQLMLLAQPLIDKTGASIGGGRNLALREVVPAHWLIGQSGSSVAPELLIACGLSGGYQPLAGIRESGVIVAINRNPNALIFKMVDYGLVMDMKQALPELANLL